MFNDELILECFIMLYSWYLKLFDNLKHKRWKNKKTILVQFSVFQFIQDDIEILFVFTFYQTQSAETGWVCRINQDKHEIISFYFSEWIVGSSQVKIIDHEGGHTKNLSLRTYNRRYFLFRILKLWENRWKQRFGDILCL